MSKELAILKKNLEKERAQKIDIIHQRKKLDEDEKKCDDKINWLRGMITEANSTLDIIDSDNELERRSVGLKKPVKVWILDTLSNAISPLSTQQIVRGMLKNGWETASGNPVRVLYPDIWKMRKRGWLETREDGTNTITERGKKELTKIKNT